jgi:hypothetical protein
MKPNRVTFRMARHMVISAACVAATGWCLPAAAQAVSALGSAKLNRIALNPQPLPPKILATPGGGLTQPTAGQDRSIIIVSGQPAAAASLNPQPLPPKGSRRSTFDVRAGLAQRGIIIVSGKSAGHGAP